ncbi:MAG: YgfZ/GcvT domain-containing protein [Terriglobales bacterium]
MAKTPYLYDKLASAGARFGEYHGVETAAAFTDPKAEYRALHSGCGVFDYAWRVQFKVTGEDRVRWLNGMVTNNVRDLAVNHGVYCFLLNPQGHILGDMYVFNPGDALQIETDASQGQALVEVFDKYIIMDDVELDAPAPRSAAGVAGPKAEEVLERAGFSAGGLAPLEVRKVSGAEFEVTLIRLPYPVEAYEVLFAPESAAKVWDGQVTAGATPVGYEALELWRVSLGVPRYAQDIRQRDLPQETEQQHALHFTKGCYVGQEIVERIRSRGQVHRKLTGLVIDGPAPPPGTKISAGGKAVGEITSVASLPSANGKDTTVALGYIRREAGAPGAVVQVEGAQATVTALPVPEAR